MLRAVSREHVLAILLGLAACGEDAVARSSDPPRAETSSTSAEVRSVARPTPAPQPTPAPLADASSLAKPKTIAFVGDVALSMHVAVFMQAEPGSPDAQEPGYPFAAVAERLRSYDLTVGNLECVVANRGSPTIPLPLVAPLHAPQVLLDAGFDVVSIGNNHAEDLGKAGYDDMRKRLTAAGLPFVGGYLTDPTVDPMVVRDVGGVKVAIIGYFNRDTADTYADLKRANELADVVIVFIHWGIDFSPDPTRFQRQWGRAMIEHGADAVVGAHSHVVQPEEIHEGKLIAHSLGNFVFSGMIRRGSRDGAILELDVDRSGVVAHRFQPVRLDERGAPSLVGSPTPTAPLTPNEPRPLTPMGKPIHFETER
jgi:poly-gamma-glutamate capsule biosynthesis protein CapA/YwtB (metallophosphatase superfamily)